MRYRYRGFGLEIASDFAIPGAVDCPDSTEPTDLIVTAGTSGLGAEAEDVPPYRRLGEQLELVVSGIGRYRLESVNRLAVIPEPQAAAHDVSALLIASGLPLALWARGGLVLHASGVVPAGSEQGIAIAGASGCGKSTLARALVERGGKLIGDDALWLRNSRGGPIASGLPGGSFAPDAGQPERPFWPTPAAARAETAALGAVVVLDPALAAGPPQRLTGPAALAALLRHRHRPRIPALLGVEPERLAFTALLCGAVPVYALGGPPGADVARIEHICGLALAAPQSRSA